MRAIFIIHYSFFLIENLLSELSFDVAELKESLHDEKKESRNDKPPAPEIQYDKNSPPVLQDLSDELQELSPPEIQFDDDIINDDGESEDGMLHPVDEADPVLTGLFFILNFITLYNF